MSTPPRPAIARARRDNAGWLEQPLEEHLAGVAALCRTFAEPFGAATLGQLAGLWHDLGKFAPDWQRFIRDAVGLGQPEGEDAHLEDENRGQRGPDHSAAGALHAIESLGAVGQILAQLIAAHHHGLYDAIDLVTRLGKPETRERLRRSREAAIPASILDAHRSLPPDFDPRPAQDPTPGAYALWLRMLFSALIDADRLDSEAFGDGGRARATRAAQATLAQLKPDYDAHMARFAADSNVRRLRAEVLADCRRAATGAIGPYTLTVPTGGGKTLASLGFAIEHALAHGLKRVIYVIPYTSIIEQTADVFRSISPAFANAVIEHHSNAGESSDSCESERARLAVENWDAPLIITTSVQFFESLFAARPSRCRKLHNVAESVVILDEAQLLPPAFLQPIVDALGLLGRHYRMTLVLTTATQPALASSRRFGKNFRGLDSTREIVSNVDRLYRELKRVEVRLPSDPNARSSWPELAERVIGERDDVLAIVNRRAEARSLFRELEHREPGQTLHLSALMCGAHRSDAIAEIKRRLMARRENASLPPLRVVSTQLVECGVDLDLPVVYRAFAGLDSIAQAAGRCNREGRLTLGRVEVFVGDKDAPRGGLALAEAAAREVLHGHQGDPLDRALFEPYFSLYYNAQSLDAKNIAAMLAVDPNSCGVERIRSAADAFELIDNDETGYRSVYVPYRRDDDDRLFEELIGVLRKEGPQRWLLRKLQRYTVSLPPYEFTALSNRRDIEEVLPGFWALRSAAQYSNTLGLLTDGGALDASSLHV